MSSKSFFGFDLPFQESKEAKELLLLINKMEGIANKLNNDYKNYNYNSSNIIDNLQKLNYYSTTILNHINYYDNYYNNPDFLWHSCYCNNMKDNLFNIESNKIIKDSCIYNYTKTIIGAFVVVSLAIIINSYQK